MILVYYRRNDGKIRNVHQYPVEKGLDAAKEAVRCYNEEQRGEYTAYVMEYSDNSIEAYLYMKTVEKKIRDRKTVEDLISALEEALDASRCLEVYGNE